MITAPIIFLDFDGVLSPGLSGTLIYRHALGAFLLKHSTVQVVFSTSWRLHYSFSDLCSLFPSNLAKRFLGSTPDLESSVNVALREKEIQAWRTQEQHIGKWVALDDDLDLFSPTCKELILCNPARGIREPQFSQMLDKLSLVSHSATVCHS